MNRSDKKPRILIVTPEVTYIPEGMGGIANGVNAKSGGLADVSTALINALFKQGADVHVALPDYRDLFNGPLPHTLVREWNNIQNDWMTGLIPAMARAAKIPCLLTLHNVHTIKETLALIEDRGIDAGSFWQNLYFERIPSGYEETRNSNPVDFLTSGVFAAHFVNVVSRTFLIEIIDGRHPFVDKQLQTELAHKCRAGCATGIINAPDQYIDLYQKILWCSLGIDWELAECDSFQVCMENSQSELNVTNR